MEPKSTFSCYRDRIRASLPRHPKLGWLHRFLNGQIDLGNGCSVDQSKLTDFRTYTCELSDKFAVEEIKDSASLQSLLANDDAGTALTGRLVVVQYKDSGTIDRNVIDVVAEHYSLEPYTLADHLQEYQLSYFDFTYEYDAFTQKTGADYRSPEDHVSTPDVLFGNRNLLSYHSGSLVFGLSRAETREGSIVSFASIYSDNKVQC